ncbi:hypothetical protein [Spirosoma foliorum]|uniref:Uncharacterized protein n=1 Tax=Spirosoma foliorum TaxID=2710596 RepID=A0A7G5H2M5_9BACT|nr:hypothetical protein [Spirosoma foliorum]QMW05367.1 hypothetical protein H3H32_10980 [Spirosoma foliorum]
MNTGTQIDLFAPPETAHWIDKRLYQLREHERDWTRDFLNANDEKQGEISLVLVHIKMHIGDLEKAKQELGL